MVRQAFMTLEKADQTAVLVHLHEIVEGEGWQDAQREAANSALLALENT